MANLPCNINVNVLEDHLRALNDDYRVELRNARRYFDDIATHLDELLENSVDPPYLFDVAYTHGMNRPYAPFDIFYEALEYEFMMDDLVTDPFLYATEEHILSLLHPENLQDLEESFCNIIGSISKIAKNLNNLDHRIKLVLDCRIDDEAKSICSTLRNTFDVLKAARSDIRNALVALGHVDDDNDSDHDDMSGNEDGQGGVFDFGFNQHHEGNGHLNFQGDAHNVAPSFHGFYDPQYIAHQLVQAYLTFIYVSYVMEDALELTADAVDMVYEIPDVYPDYEPPVDEYDYIGSFFEQLNAQYQQTRSENPAAIKLNYVDPEAYKAQQQAEARALAKRFGTFESIQPKKRPSAKKSPEPKRNSAPKNKRGSNAKSKGSPNKSRSGSANKKSKPRRSNAKPKR